MKGIKERRKSSSGQLPSNKTGNSMADEFCPLRGKELLEYREWFRKTGKGVSIGKKE